MRKRLFGGLGFAAALLTVWLGSQAATATEVMVYKSPTCGCCSAWVDHLRKNGFTVRTHDVDDMNQIKHKYGVTGRTASCHTALVDGYVVEGHVPADTIRRLLKERPLVTGIAAPGMPIGSPGMEVKGQPAERYDVVAFDNKGKTTVYERR